MKKKELSVNQIKLLTYGGLGFAFIGMLSVNFFMSSFSSSTDKEASKENVVEQSSTLLNEETVAIEQKNGVVEKTEDEIKNIKSEVWSLLEDLKTDEASKKMLEVYKTVVFTEENELEKWHLDVSLVSTAAMLPYDSRTELFAGLKLPRFKTAFSVFANPLSVSELVADKQSLVPVDVESFWIERERYLTPKEFEALDIESTVANNLKSQSEMFYVAEIRYDETKVNGVSAILENGEVVLIGYFSDKQTAYETAQFWDNNRNTFENISALN